MNYAALKAEITGGPFATELAPFVSARNVAEVHSRLNLLRASIQIARGVVPVDDFLSDLSAAIEAARVHVDPTKKQKWLDRMTYLIRGKLTINISGGRFAPFLADAVADGLITQAAADAVKTRNGSRVEQLGWTVTYDDVNRVI